MVWVICVSREDIKKKTELCSRYQIAVLGNVVVDGK
jgi:phage gp37-like protein